MLKELVRERLIAAADEIFGLFEKTIATYEEQLRRAREDSERHRRQLEHVYNAQVVIRLKDIQPQWGGSSTEPEHPQPPRFVRAEENPQPAVSMEEDAMDPRPPRVKEEDIVAFALPDDTDGGEDEGKPPKRLTPADHLVAPLFEEPPRSRQGGGGGGGAQSEYSAKETTPQRPPQRFVCSFCHKAFAANSVLKIHLRTHTGEKPFPCPLCGKRFAQKQSVATHMKTHTGEKPFGCSVCHKTFSRRYHLEIHMRTHTGEKPYRCSVCGANFRHRSSLKVHMRVHNAERTKTASP